MYVYERNGVSESSRILLLYDDQRIEDNVADVSLSPEMSRRSKYYDV